MSQIVNFEYLDYYGQKQTHPIHCSVGDIVRVYQVDDEYHVKIISENFSGQEVNERSIQERYYNLSDLLSRTKEEEFQIPLRVEQTQGK